MSKKIILFVEPRLYGLNYLHEAKKLDFFSVIITSSPDNPKLYNYSEYCDDVIVCNIKDPDSIYQSIENSKYKDNFDALIPASDFVTDITAKVAEKINTKGTPFEAAYAARNKNIAREIYKKRNVPSAKFAIVKNLEEAISAAKEIQYPVILKPSNATSSQFVSFIQNENDLKKEFEKILNFKLTYMDFKINDSYLIEEYLLGPEFSIELFLDKKNVVFAEVTEKITTPTPYFVELFHIFPSSIFPNEKDNIINTAKLAANALGFINGPLHIEVKLTRDGAKIIELNGRPGGDNITSDLIMNAYGISFYKQTILQYLNMETDFTKQKDKASAIGYISANKSGLLSSIENINLLDQNRKVTRYKITASIGTHVDKPKCSDDRLGFVIIEDNTAIEAKKSIQEILDTLNVNIL